MTADEGDLRAIRLNSRSGLNIERCQEMEQRRVLESVGSLVDAVAEDGDLVEISLAHARSVIAER